MSSLKEARATYLSEWINLSAALRDASDSARAYVNKLKEEGKNPDTLEIPIILPQVEVGKKRKGAADEDEKPKTGKGSRGGKKIKDPNAPKRPPSAYILFQNTIRTKTRDENPSIPYPEVMKIIGERWNKLTEDEKKPFNDEANANMAKYKVEEEEYKANGGKIGTPSPAPEEPAPQTAKKSKKDKKEKPLPPPASSSEDDSDEESPPKHGKKPDTESEESSDSEAEAPPPSKKTKVATPAKASTSKPKSDKSSKHESKSDSKSKSKDSHAPESSKSSSKEKKDKKKKSASE